MAQQRGWDVCIIITPHEWNFLNVPSLAPLTGNLVRSGYKMLDTPDPLPRPQPFWSIICYGKVWLSFFKSFVRYEACLSLFLHRYNLERYHTESWIFLTHGMCNEL
jgi:hypothetical protein